MVIPRTVLCRARCGARWSSWVSSNSGSPLLLWGRCGAPPRAGRAAVPGSGPARGPGVSLSLAGWRGLGESQRGSGSRRPGEPQTPACGRWDRARGVLRPLVLAGGLPAAVPPWLSVVSGNQEPEEGQWGSPSASYTASSLQFVDSLEVCKTLCQHQSVCVTVYLCTSASPPASFTHLKLKWDQQDCAAHPSTHVRPAHSP